MNDRVDRESVESLISLMRHNKAWEGLQDIDVEAYQEGIDTLRALLAEREALENSNQRLKVVLETTTDYLEGMIEDGCPKCGGDCSSANPPVIFCPMQQMTKDVAEARAALAEQEKTDD